VLLALLASPVVADPMPRVKDAAVAPEAPAKAGPALEAPAKPGPRQPLKRRIYVLHSGVHTILAHPNKNIFVENIRDMLTKRGLPEKDIVLLDNPYPTARWYNMFPTECLTMFMASARPDSKVALDAYARMDKALKAQDVTGDDDLVFVGHSAGGQMCLTLAY